MNQTIKNPSKKNIFLIEDDLITRNIVEYILNREFDCNIENYSDSKTAMLAIKTGQPDIIVLDYNLNSQDKSTEGQGFLKFLNDEKFNIPTVVFSEQKDKEVALKMMRVGAVDYISKNSESYLEDLISTLKNISNLLDSKKEISYLNQKRKGNYIRISLIILFMVMVLCLLIFV